MAEKPDRKPAATPPPRLPEPPDDFSVGIFDVEERAFEPVHAPSVAVVEPTIEDSSEETIIVEGDGISSETADHPQKNQREARSDITARAADRHGEEGITDSASAWEDSDFALGLDTAAADDRAAQAAPPPVGTNDHGTAETADVEPDESRTAGRAQVSEEERRSRGPRRRGGRRGRRGREPSDVVGAAEDDEALAPRRTPRGDGAAQEEADVDAMDTDEEGQDISAEPVDKSRREMLINVSDPDEVRIALLRDGRLDELYIERAASVSNVGNIYKGRVTNIEPSIQAAFVDFGKPVQGFLHISDLHPNYFPESKGEPELVGRKTPRRHRPPIQQCLKRGQEVIVQVIKEGVGTKGPTLSTYISLPGRFLVMMPGMDQLGVSRKIEDDDTRRKVRSVLGQLTLPNGFGFIVRTAGINRTKRDLQRDLNYLARLWDKVQARNKKEPAPTTLYKESDLVIRTIRDVFDSNFQRIVVDNPTVAQRVREFLSIASPKAQDVVELYESPEPLFHRFGIEIEIDKLYSRHVPLPCGGSLVIESTEALVAIDVNSGRFRVMDNPEETAYRVNLEAAEEIARQLRLRDLGGLIIIDFIDMMQEKHKRAVERVLHDALRKHKERAKLLRISRFGILEMTRQRQRPSFAKSMFMECPRCTGSGRVKATETVALDVMRDIRLASQREGVASVDVTVPTAVANDLLNRKRQQLVDLERAHGISVRVHADPALSGDEVRISSTDRRGREIPTGAVAVRPMRAPQPRSSSPSATRSSPSSSDRGQRSGSSRGRRGRRGGRRARSGRSGASGASGDAGGGGESAGPSA